MRTFTEMADNYNGLIRSNKIMMVIFIAETIVSFAGALFIPTLVKLPIVMAILFTVLMAAICIGSLHGSKGTYHLIGSCKKHQKECRDNAVQYGETK